MRGHCHEDKGGSSPGVNTWRPGAPCTRAAHVPEAAGNREASVLVVAPADLTARRWTTRPDRQERETRGIRACFGGVVLTQAEPTPRHWL